MIEWIKLDTGEYESKDGRFHALRSYDRIYGNHWELHDRTESDYYKGLYHEETLRMYKAMAETLLCENCICNSKDGCIRRDLEETIPVGQMPCK